MIKTSLVFLSFLFFGTVLMAQPGSKEQQELENERQRLKRELDQTQDQLNSVKKTTKEILGQKILIDKKLNIQEKVITNISRDINLLDNTIYKSQRDINKLQLLLDTLKQEYSKSMVYAYKNRSNSDFLNFIFSSSSFNDAIKRITYLKSYRNYREMQGENILRTQALMQQRIGELSGSKQKKNQVLQVQSKEIGVLQTQQEEKKTVMQKLKAQSKELNNQIAAKKKQMQKVSNAIAAAIKRARDEAIAKAKLDAERERKAEAKEKADNAGNNTKAVTKTTRTKTPATKQESVLLRTDADVKLNASFESNRGSLPWPVDKGYVMMHFGPQNIEGMDRPLIMNNPGITIASDIGSTVKAVFDGEVASVTNIDNMQAVVVKHGRYFTTYSNLSGVGLSKGQAIKTGQTIGKVAANDDGVGTIDLIISNEKSDLNPEAWLRRR